MSILGQSDLTGNFILGECGNMLTSLVSFFAGLKTKHLLALLGLLGLLGSMGLCYKAGRSDGFSSAQAEYLKSVDQNKDQVIEELRVISDRQVAQILENRQANVNLSRLFKTEVTNLENELKAIPNETPTIVNTDCRAEYAGTIGVFKQLANAGSESNTD